MAALTESRERRIQLVRGVAIGLLGWLAIAIAYGSGVFDTFDLKLLDWRFRLRGERQAPDPIALVEVDDATIRAYGSWPLPRDAYALLLAALEEGGARAIGVDLQFPADANQDPRSNLLLAQVAAAHDNVVAAVWFRAEEVATGDPESHPAATLEAFQRQGVTFGDVALAEARHVTLPFDELVSSTKVMGHISVAVDPDGAIRRLPVLVRYGDRAYPALPLCLAGLFHGQPRIADVLPTRGGFRVRWPGGLEVQVPTDPAGATAIDYAGDRKAFRRSYSMLDVLQWYRVGDLARIRDAFSGRIALVGLTSRQEALVDVGTTPFSMTTPLVYVHANALENLLRGRFLTRISGVPYLELLAVLAATLAAVFAVVTVPAAIIVMVGSLLALAGLDFALLALGGVDLPPVAALLLPPLTYAAIQSHRFLFLQKRSRQRDADIRAGLTVQQQFLPEALVGKKLGHYLIEAKIGAGGMGVVYRAKDSRLHRDVAVKVLPGGVLADELARRRFRRQALVLSKLSHPGLASVYDFDTQDGVDFIVMEYVPGVSVEQRLRRGPISENEAIRIAIAITEALGEAHAHGIIHRDIKPANVMVTPKGGAKLLDFGIARIAFIPEASMTLTNLTRDGDMVGTLAYMSPELLSGRTAGVGTDIYGVGALMFEMMTGRRPFADDAPRELMYVIVNQDPPRPRVLNGRLTTAIEAVILRTLRKLPEERFESASTLLAALRSVELKEPATAPGL